MYQYQSMAYPSASAASSHPVHPYVRLKRLPFYDVLGEILRPSSLGMQTVYFFWISLLIERIEACV
jgi:hypothetical protein